MSEIKDGGAAFPVPMFSIGLAKYEAQQQGLSLRDYFAAKAMQTRGFTVRPYDTTDEVAKDCYRMADALLKARGRV